MRVIVSGPPRSGTTWIARGIAESIGVRYLEEPDNPDKDPGAWPSVLSHGLCAALEPRQSDPPMEALWDLALSGGWRLPKRNLVRLLAARLDPRTTAPLIRLAARNTARLRGRARDVLVKSVSTTFALEWMAERYQPRIVLVTRHPLNIISSWLALGWHFGRHYYGREEEEWLDRHRTADETLPPLPEGSELTRVTWWVGVLLQVQEATARRHPEWLTISHDDACMDAGRVFSDVVSWLGKEPDGRLRDYLERPDGPATGYELTHQREQRPDIWRERLSDQQVDEALSVLSGFPRARWNDPLRFGQAVLT